MNDKTDQTSLSGQNAKPYSRAARFTQISLRVLYGCSRVLVDSWLNTPVSRSFQHLSGQPDKRKRQQTNSSCNKWKGTHATQHPSSYIWLCPPYAESTFHPCTQGGGNNMWHLLTTSPAMISKCIGSRERLTCQRNNHCRT